MTQLAIIGLGYWGPNLLRNFDQLRDCEVKFCCDLNYDNLLRIKEQYPHIVITKDYKGLMEDNELEAIVIATSASSHYNLVKEALLHRKHVFVEKPLVLNLEHATELVNLAEKTNRRLMVGHLMEYHPAVEKLKEIIQSGELGEIYYLYSQRVNLGKIRQDENALLTLRPIISTQSLLKKTSQTKRKQLYPFISMDSAQIWTRYWKLGRNTTSVSSKMPPKPLEQNTKVGRLVQ